MAKAGLNIDDTLWKIVEGELLEFRGSLHEKNV